MKKQVPIWTSPAWGLSGIDDTTPALMNCTRLAFRTSGVIAPGGSPPGLATALGKSRWQTLPTTTKLPNGSGSGQPSLQPGGIRGCPPTGTVQLPAASYLPVNRYGT